MCAEKSAVERVDRYLKSSPQTVFCGFTGTTIAKSLKDFIVLGEKTTNIDTAEELQSFLKKLPKLPEDRKQRWLFLRNPEGVIQNIGGVLIDPEGDLIFLLEAQ